MGRDAGNRFLGPPGVTTLWLDPNVFATMTGSPTVVSGAYADTTTRLNMRGFPDAASTIIGTQAALAGWGAFHVDLYWSNPGANSGDVVWQVRATAGLTDGAAIDGANSAASAAITAPAQNVLKISRMVTAQQASAAVIKLNVQRAGAAVDDTLADTAWFVGVLLTRAG
jgi:hypothetical protein